MSKILIVEDDQSIAELEKDYLELSNFQVEIAPDGHKGLQKALEGGYDLYIIDVMLPGLDGFQLCSKIRESQNVPILLVTAKQDELDKIRGLGMGADDYITKPFSPGELLARVKAHLGRYDRLTGVSAEKGQLIEIRGLRIDRAARRVWVDEREISLTSREYELLTYMALNPNKVFSRQELFRNIWGMECVGDVATVTVHIKKIREKIELKLSNPQYIETIWGVGYRFKM
ncbi:MAG: response regulator transcription factor [Lachnospiraceae bacterium]|nr:response regulator transcription factor [Lachnospiraceae bacterium]